MGVLCEALSVVIPMTVLEERFPGGVAGYAENCPNSTFCSDGHLTRVGFMALSDVGQFARMLEQHGIRAHDGEKFVDAAVVDQLSGLTAPCEWLHAGRHEDGYSVAWLAGTEPFPMGAPEWWSPELSKELNFYPESDIGGRLLPLRNSDGLQVLLDFETGKEVFVSHPMDRFDDS